MLTCLVVRTLYLCGAASRCRSIALKETGSPSESRGEFPYYCHPQM